MSPLHFQHVPAHRTGPLVPHGVCTRNTATYAIEVQMLLSGASPTERCINDVILTSTALTCIRDEANASQTTLKELRIYDIYNVSLFAKKYFVRYI